MAVGDNVLGSATHVEDVTPSDADDLDQVCRALYVGTGGDVAVVMRDGTAATFKNVPDGAMLDLRVRRVNATGTTADDIIAIA